MGKEKPLVKKCKYCQAEIDYKAKVCPVCRKTLKKGHGCLVPCLIGFLFFAVCTGSTGLKSDKQTSDSESAQSSEETAVPDIELSTDFEKAVWEAVNENEGKLSSIGSFTLENEEGETFTAAVACENDEDTVNSILEAVAEIIKNNDTNENCILVFGDIEKGDDAPALVTAIIDFDGTIEITSSSSDYNSARNQWIRNQFSVWNGANLQLEQLIISSLNDEKSYKHISTSYRDIVDETVRDEVNQILESAGYQARVEVDDLFIQTNFSAKNGYGATVKGVAYGIASYTNNSITLIGIE